MCALKYDVKEERQSLPFSCAAKSAQLLMNYADPGRMPLGYDAEMDVLHQSKAQEYPEATHTGIALYARKKGYGVVHLVATPELYKYPWDDPYAMPFDEFQKKVSIDHVFNRQACDMGAELWQCGYVNELTILHLLDTRGPIVAMTDAGGGLHDLIVAGYDYGVFHVIDPAGGSRVESAYSFVEKANTKYGHSILSFTR
jgi:hypothetical protein